MENEHVARHLADRINRDTVMVTDSYAPYKYFAEMENIQIEQIISSQHARGAFNLGHINSLHSRLSAFWPKEAECDPATKYIDLHLILFWWLEKNKNMPINDKVDKLYNLMSEQFYDDLSYDRLVHRSLVLDTKNMIPKFV